MLMAKIFWKKYDEAKWHHLIEVASVIKASWDANDKSLCIWTITEIAQSEVKAYKIM